MLQILTKNNFITDTIFSDICSENIFENEIKKFDNIAKGLFDNSSETNSSNIKFKFIELNKVAKFVFAELKANNLTDQNFFLYINELEQLFRLELEQYEDFFLKRLSYEKKIEKNILHDKKFFFNKLKLETLNKILNIANKYKEKFEINISKKLNSRKDLSINTGKDIRKIIKILNDEFDQNGVNNIVSNYVKKEFKVIGCAIELSTPDSTWWKQNKNKKLSSKTIYAHIDQSLICPKSICYLTDVKIENGPTSFYPNIYEDLKLNFFQNIFGRINLSVAQDKKSKLYKIYNKKSNRLDESSEQLRHLKKIPRNIFLIVI